MLNPHSQGLACSVFVVKVIRRHAVRGVSALGGIIYNVRGSLDDIALVKESAAKIGSMLLE